MQEIGTAMAEFARLAAVEDATRAVFAAAAAAEGPQSRVAAAPDLERAAREMLSFTGAQQPDLTARLDAAFTELRAATPDWWQAGRGAKLTTVADVQAALDGLTGNEAERLAELAERFEDVVADVAIAANQTGERLARLRTLAQGQAELPLFAAEEQRQLLRGNIRVSIVRDWPELRVGAGPDASAVAKSMADAAAERAQAPPGQLDPSVQGAEDAFTNVFAAAIREWLPRRTAALRLAERVRELLPEAGERREKLAAGLDRAYRAVTAVRIPDQPGTSAELEDTGQSLATVATRMALLESAIGAVLTVTIDEPIRQAADAIAGLSGEALRLLEYTGDRLIGRDAELQASLADAAAAAAAAPLAPQPPRLESVTEVSSARQTRETLSASIPDFAATVAATIQAGWEPRLAAVNDLVGRARQLLRQAGEGLAGEGLAGEGLAAGLQRNLTRALDVAAGSMAPQLPDLPAEPQTAQLENVRAELASVTAVETAISNILAAVHSMLGARVTLAADRAEAARSLLPYTGDQAGELGADLRNAERDVLDRPGPPQRPPATAAAMDAVQAWLTSVTELEVATGRVLTAATAGYDELRPRAAAAYRLAVAAQALLPHAGRRQADDLNAAVGLGLAQAVPAWWPEQEVRFFPPPPQLSPAEVLPETAGSRRAAFMTVPEIEAARAAVARSEGRAELQDAVQEVELAVSRVLAAAVPDWEQTAAGLRAAALGLLDLLPHTGDRRAELATEVRAALQRVDADPRGMRGPPPQDSYSVPEMEAVIPSMALVADLESVIGAVTRAASGPAREHARFLRQLGEQARDLLPRAGQPDRPGAGRRTAKRPSDLDVLEESEPGPVTAAGRIRAARHALALAAHLRDFVAGVLAQAAGGLPDRVAAATALFTGMGTEPPIAPAQRDDLDALIGLGQNVPGALAAAPDTEAAVAVARQGMIAPGHGHAASARAGRHGPGRGRASAAGGRRPAPGPGRRSRAGHRGRAVRARRPAGRPAGHGAGQRFRPAG